jgi:hypothetical protein
VNSSVAPALYESYNFNFPNSSMTVNQNFAAWLPGVGKQIEVSHADVPEPGAGEILVEVSK